MKIVILMEDPKSFDEAFSGYPKPCSLFLP